MVNATNHSAIYIPNSPGLWQTLNDLPRDLVPYEEHVMFFIQSICGQRWSREKNEKVNPGGYSNLNTSILRGYIPKSVLTSLKSFLESQHIIETRPHSAGRRSRGYRIAEAFKGPPSRQIIRDARLSAKLTDWRMSFKGASSSPELEAVIKRRQPMLEHMRSDLSVLSLDSPVIAYNNAISEGVDEDYADYICQIISNGDCVNLTVDDFGWRAHTVATRTAKEIRKSFLLENKPTTEVDIRNMQPLMLSLLISPNISNTPITKPYTNMMSEIKYPDIFNSEAGQFKVLCQEGKMYEALMSSTGYKDRSRVKNELFRDVLFGKLTARGPVKDAFAKEWPTIDAAIMSLKRQFGYKIISQCLQRLESTIMIDGVCGRLVNEHPQIRFVTIHDSVVVANDHTCVVNEVIDAEFKKYGIACSLSETKNNQQ